MPLAYRHDVNLIVMSYVGKRSMILHLASWHITRTNSCLDSLALSLFQNKRGLECVYRTSFMPCTATCSSTADLPTSQCIEGPDWIQQSTQRIKGTSMSNAKVLARRSPDSTELGVPSASPDTRKLHRHI